MKSCLLSGGSRSLGGSSKVPDPGPYSSEVEAVLAAYLPLLEPLEYAEIFLEPHPFVPPAGFRGEIFRSKTDGSLYVTLVGSSVRRTLKITVRGADPACARFRSVAQADWVQAEVRGDGIVLPGGSCAYIVHLPRGAKD